MTLVETAVLAARAGGEVLVANWRNLPHGSVEEKTKNDFVTHADRESEERIISSIRAQYPEDSFLGEEGVIGDEGSVDHRHVDVGQAARAFDVLCEVPDGSDLHRRPAGVHLLSQLSADPKRVRVVGREQAVARRDAAAERR